MSKENNVSRHIPVNFEKLDEVDDRFMEVKIWLMHLEENYNGSYFSKEAVENAIPSLANTPILGYIEDNNDGEEDFSDHRQVIVKEDGNYKIKYIGQAYGVIPETNDAKFEKRVGEDGREREYLTVKGVVWKKWDDPIEIFERDEVKGQSMELHEDFDGEFNEDDGLFHFSNFKFFGACALGDDVQPAMESATIEKDFSAKALDDYVQEKMEEYKKLAMQRQKNDKEGEPTEFENNEGGNKMGKEFSLSSGQLTSEFDRILSSDFEEDDWGFKRYNYYYVDYTESHVIAQSRKDDFRLVGFSYKVNGDVPEIDFDSKQVFKIEFKPVEAGEEGSFNFKHEKAVQYEADVKAEEVKKESKENFEKEKNEAVGEVQVELDNVQKEFETLKQETEGLRNTVRDYQTKERKEAEESLFSSFEANFSKEDEDFENLKNKAHEFENLEDLEKELFALVGKKKANFSTSSKPKQKESVKVPIDNEGNEEANSKYGELGVRYKD